ncbi:ABC transporter, ATP-binding protein domain containing protein [Babesia caballi]|uniref:ABC transporter, ATP-binding protein domain containing protein n=1 Tax=Babesia caballi TaxID=5871 RepID=A0AAV4LPJ3_BABCB|nr:ABC transporter, ATP-binding protein domain containing protein [Babesia caballi]
MSAETMPLDVEAASHGRRLHYFDESGFFSRLFISWVSSWVGFIDDVKFNLQSVHPLPKADDLSKWQTIFAKHVSDGVLRLEQSRSQPTSPASDASSPELHWGSSSDRPPKPYRSIFLRAMMLTFWIRALLTLVGIVVVNLISMGSAIMLKYMLDMMSKASFQLQSLTLIVCVVVAVDATRSILQQQLELYMVRLVICMEAVTSITLFQHGLCFRRQYTAAFDSNSPPGTCKNIIHFEDPSGSSCSKDPLLCPARRHQNHELPQSMYTHMALDATTITQVVNSVAAWVGFVCSFISGMLFLKVGMGFPILLPSVTVLSLVFVLLVLQSLSGFLRRYSLESMDYRVAVSSDVLGNLQLCTAMGIDDVGYRGVEHSRQDELSALRARLFLHLLNRNIERSLAIVLFWIFAYVFNGELNLAQKTGKLPYEVNELISVIFILSKIVMMSARLPRSFREIVESITSYRRVEAFLRSCSPNFYLDPRNQESTSPRHVDLRSLSEEISPDTVVYYKDASFCHMYERSRFINADGTAPAVVFKSLDFHLKRGDVKIVTGANGCGKTSFIKSILGEMSLISGRMAVAPLSTGMPIFYSSQEVWMPRGTIRSIITFGYAFDSDIYSRVLAALVLDADIMSWPEGDEHLVTEKGYTLSACQRLRLSLARALYAYLLFSKANEGLDDPCCFLMCLDEPFEGIEPDVVCSILRNLLNANDGLLVRGDLALVMTVSRATLDLEMTQESASSLVDIATLVIEDGTIRSSGRLSDRERAHQEPDAPAPKTAACNARYNAFMRSLSGVSAGPLCSTTSGLVIAEPETPRNAGQPSDDPIGDKETLSYTRSAYMVYLRATGYGRFGLLLLLLLLTNTAVSLKLITAAKWVDTMRTVGVSTDLAGIIATHRTYYLWITIFSSLSVSCLFTLSFVVVLASLRGSRRLYNFALRSMFDTTSTAAKLRSCMGSLLTFITSDIHIIDEMIGLYIYETAFAFSSFLMKLVALCYMMPVAVPVPLATTFALYLFSHRRFLRSAKILQRMMLEANSNVYSVFNNAISGSSVCRGFHKEGIWLEEVRVRSDEYYRTKFFKMAYTNWVTLITRLSAALMIAVFTMIPALRAHFNGTDIQVGHLGIAISLCLGFINSLKALITKYSQLEKHMCSMARFERYFLQNKVNMKATFESMGETMLSGYKSVHVGDVSASKRDSVSTCSSRHHGCLGSEGGSVETIGGDEGTCGGSCPESGAEGSTGDAPLESLSSHLFGYSREDARVLKLMKRRRRAEYRAFAFRRYTSVFVSRVYRPRIEVLHPSDYIPDSSSIVELRNVSVVNQSAAGAAASGNLLSGVSAHAHAGEIIGIVGPSRTAKNALLGVLQGILPDREGSVLLGGRDLNTVPRRLLRHIIGVLPQTPVILKGWTVRRFIDPRMLYTDDEILEALEFCGMLDVVQSLPGDAGLDTVLVPDGISARRILFLVPPLVPLSGHGVGCLRTAPPPQGATASGATRRVLSASQQRQLWFASLFLYRHAYRILLIDEPLWSGSASPESSDPSPLPRLRDPNSGDDGVPAIYQLVRRYFSHCITFVVVRNRSVLGCCTRLWNMQSGASIEECTVEEFLPKGVLDSPPL